MGNVISNFDNPCNSQDILSFQEIHFLSYISGKSVQRFNPPAYFAYKYQMDIDATIDKITTLGYLKVGTPLESIPFFEMPVLRQLAKQKGLKSGGKKADIVQRILDNYTIEELNINALPEYYVLTSLGEELLNNNQVLLLFLRTSWPTEWVNPEEVIEIQNMSQGQDAEQVLIDMIQSQIAQVKTKYDLFLLLRCLYMLCRDESDRIEIDAKCRSLEEALESERQEFWSRKEPDIEKALGMSLAERRALQQQAADEIDDEWERELDAKNRAKRDID